MKGMSSTEGVAQSTTEVNSKISSKLMSHTDYLHAFVVFLQIFVWFILSHCIVHWYVLPPFPNYWHARWCHGSHEIQILSFGSSWEPPFQVPDEFIIGRNAPRKSKSGAQSRAELILDGGKRNNSGREELVPNLLWARGSQEKPPRSPFRFFRHTSWIDGWGGTWEIHSEVYGTWVKWTIHASPKDTLGRDCPIKIQTAQEECLVSFKLYKMELLLCFIYIY